MFDCVYTDFQIKVQIRAAEHSIEPGTFLYLSHPKKIDVTSGLIGAQQPVSAKSNDGVWVRHDFFGFLSHRYQEL